MIANIYRTPPPSITNLDVLVNFLDAGDIARLVEPDSTSWAHCLLAVSAEEGNQLLGVAQTWQGRFFVEVNERRFSFLTANFIILCNN